MTTLVSEQFGLRQELNALLERAFPGKNVFSLTDIPSQLVIPVVDFLHKVNRYDCIILRAHGIVPGDEDLEDERIIALLNRNPYRTWLWNLLTILVSRNRKGREEFLKLAEVTQLGGMRRGLGAGYYGDVEYE